jgi:hypothetical protein
MKDLVVCEPQNRIAVCPQQPAPSFVSRDFRFRRMGRAIDLDNQPHLVTGEIDDKSAENDLPPESKPVYPMPA